MMLFSCSNLRRAQTTAGSDMHFFDMYGEVADDDLHMEMG